MNIEKIDKNFEIKTSIEREGLVFKNALDKPFKIYGLLRENGCFVRCPVSVAEGTSEGVAFLNRNTAGGRIRFKTDSPYVAISVKYNDLGKMPHFAFSGSVGFDIYSDDGNGVYYVSTFVPPCEVTDSYEGIIDMKRKTGMHSVTVHFPLYSGVNEVYVGLKEGSVLTECDPYKIQKPVVFYGSSITQGGCASRPGNAYENIVSRLLDCDHINLGFSGNALGEQIMADYIAGLQMSAFVLDYDHNAPTPEHLEKTHENFFKTVRAKHPDIPIIMLTRPIGHVWCKEEERRIEIVRNTYENAVKSGDKNVYFIKGDEIFSDRTKETALVDGCHPNDSGFVEMAYKVYDVLKEVLKDEGK